MPHPFHAYPQQRPNVAFIVQEGWLSFGHCPPLPYDDDVAG